VNYTNVILIVGTEALVKTKFVHVSLDMLAISVRRVSVKMTVIFKGTVWTANVSVLQVSMVKVVSSSIVHQNVPFTGNV